MRTLSFNTEIECVILKAFQLETHDKCAYGKMRACNFIYEWFKSHGTIFFSDFNLFTAAVIGCIVLPWCLD